ncbi:hypothetical protein BX666DRAFT_1907632 [Dichotomocladium elegans]|nr:hypothetical protein BX666DRAFT_1907632 [Dichotomocladium elegans]
MPMSMAKRRSLPTHAENNNTATEPLLVGNHNDVAVIDASTTGRHYSTFQPSLPPPSRKQPNRTTKISQKLKLFPEDGEQTFQDRHAEVYTQLSQIPHGDAREEAKHVSRMNKDDLARVTAYCTASGYRMDALIKYLQSKSKTHGASPKRFDECLYTPYSFRFPLAPPKQDDVGKDNDEAEHQQQQEFLPEMFMFDYGVVVFWGMTYQDEQRVLKELAPYEDAKLDTDDIEVEEFRYYYNENCQPRIYNDIITLRHPSNYLVKLTIAHAIAQSVKMTLFERLIDDTINETKYIPQVMAESGNIRMSRTAITKKIGQLFIMRINVNLVSNILDTPEIFWSEPALEPLYSAIRGYLEISQRVELLNQRVEVISDLLDMLKDHLNSSHSEYLEWIVIWLIGMEILVAVITTCLDAFSISKE